MEKIKSILRRFKSLLYAWWYKVSSWVINEEIGAFLGNLAALIAASLILFGLCSCGTTKIATVENKEITKVEIRDSIVYRDTTIYIPKERIVEVTPQLDTLRMEIDNAVSTAYLDTTMLMLRGTLESKRATQKEYIERIEYRERTDTVYIERPQPYEVPKPYTPKWAWWSLIINIVGVLLVAFKLYLRFKP